MGCDADGPVRELVASGATVYAILGYAIPIWIGGQTRSSIAALDARTGKATAWNPKPDKGVFTLAVPGQTVYVAGYFDSIGGQARHGIAALHARTGNATAWNPQAEHSESASYGVPAVAISGSTVYVGGEVTSIGGQPRNCIAAANARTGKATAWNPRIGKYAYAEALAVAGGNGYIRTGGRLLVTPALN
jgi:hypothetical protein